MNHKSPYLLEVFPWLIPEEFILNSIKNELDGLKKSHSIYTIHYILSGESDIPTISQYIQSSDEIGQSFLVNFYSKLYKNDISFLQVESLPHITVDGGYSIGLNNHYVFQIKKPWEIGLNTFSSSAWIVENMINELIPILKKWNKIHFSLQFQPTSYNAFVKDILYAWKERNMSIEWKEELQSSFTEKLDFFLFDFQIQNNFEDQYMFQEVLSKNLWIYEWKWNRYTYQYKEKYIPTLTKSNKKAQVDQFLWHWLITLIWSNNPATSGNFSKILPITQNIQANNWVFQKWWEVQPAIIGRWYKGLIQNQKHYVCLDIQKLKNPHSLILWATWSGKSFSTSQYIGFESVKMIEQDRILFEKKDKPRSSKIVIDPHNSLSQGVFLVLEAFNEKKNFKYQSEFKVQEYSRDWVSQDIRWYNIPLEQIKLTFNPLDLGKKSIREKEHIVKNIQKATSACLEWIKWIYTEKSFWAQNEDIIWSFIQLFILLNYLKRQEQEGQMEYEGIYTIWDIYKTLIYIEQTGTIPINIRQDITNALHNENPDIKTMAEEMKEKTQYHINQIRSVKWYLSSSINKLSEYRKSLYLTFWWGIYHKSYSLNLEDLYLDNPDISKILLFNLGDYESTEKNIIASFLLSYSYYFWSQKNHLNQDKLGEHSIILDEASSLLNGDYIITLLWKCLAEMRKYGMSYSFMMQSINQKWFQEIYPNVWYILLFSVDMKQWGMIEKDINSWISGTFISASDVINNKLGSFYAFFKFKNWGNSTILIEGLSMKKDEFSNLIL
jgi:hypothetical protein